jgi:hypothetical protein
MYFIDYFIHFIDYSNLIPTFEMSKIKNQLNLINNEKDNFKKNYIFTSTYGIVEHRKSRKE